MLFMLFVLKILYTHNNRGIGKKLYYQTEIAIAVIPSYRMPKPKTDTPKFFYSRDSARMKL
jgi:hypothetical protein